MQVSTNGLISFGEGSSNADPELFPTSTPDVFWSYIIAPFWADFSTTTGGLVSWEIHNTSLSSDLIAQVNQLIQVEYGDEDFSGTWMMVGFWEDIPSSTQQSVSLYNVMYVHISIHVISTL